MKITPSYLYLSLLLCLLSYAPLDAQEAFNDSVALIKRNYINATVGKDKGKEVILRQLSTIPPEKEASDQNVIELQQLYPISPKEIKHLINTLHTDGSWEDINYADTKRSGWEPKKHTERILKLTKYHYQKKQILKPSERTRLTNAIHQAMNFWFSRKLVCKNWWYNRHSTYTRARIPIVRTRNERTGKTRRNQSNDEFILRHDRTEQSLAGR